MSQKEQSVNSLNQDRPQVHVSFSLSSIGWFRWCLKYQYFFNGVTGIGSVMANDRDVTNYQFRCTSTLISIVSLDLSDMAHDMSYLQLQKK